MVISESKLLKNGKEVYAVKSDEELMILQSINAFPVQRNNGIDGFLKDYYNGEPVPVKIQGSNESLEDTFKKLERASYNKNYHLKIVIQTKEETNNQLFNLGTNIKIIKSLALQAKALLNVRLPQKTAGVKAVV
ncbi:hypothetical protein GCM10027566_39160 [Arachidicoccus ginsenosidivorans]|uniref:hypothetical protein n=1 Tax=Arachidicoccus ginsenosidivorans TaxID=496057 RepID=UPI001CEF9006|nr:hypothetical protein [Arachidicoccus ginsenosidivorans]